MSNIYGLVHIMHMCLSVYNELNTTYACLYMIRMSKQTNIALCSIKEKRVV